MRGFEPENTSDWNRTKYASRAAWKVVRCAVTSRHHDVTGRIPQFAFTPMTSRLSDPLTVSAALKGSLSSIWDAMLTDMRAVKQDINQHVSGGTYRPIDLRGPNYETAFASDQGVVGSYPIQPNVGPAFSGILTAKPL